MVKEEKAIIPMQAWQLSHPATSLSRVKAGHLEIQRRDGLGVHTELMLMELRAILEARKLGFKCWLLTNRPRGLGRVYLLL